MHQPVYRPYNRAMNQALINSLVQPQGPNPMVRACQAHQANFSPSLYAELDWQRFRPDVSDSNLQQILDLIHGLLFVIGFPTNMLARYEDHGHLRLQSLELSHFEPIFDAWQEVWMRPEREPVLASFRQWVQELRTPPRRAVEVALRERALKQLDRVLEDCSDPQNLVKWTEQILLNTQYAFLDLPWTRLAVRDSLLSSQTRSALIALLSEQSTADLRPSAMAAYIRSRADHAISPEAEEWAGLLREAADRLAGVDSAMLSGDDGDWTESRSVCGRCSMWFASRTVAAMDDTAGFAKDSSKPIMYLPHDTMVSSCPFCGFSAPNSVAALYFARQRGQVIYLAPTREGVSRSDATSIWTPAIKELQSRYLKRRGQAVGEELSAAAELVTHDLAEFFYGIQMGDTIAEDHVFNFLEMEDGYALIFDGEKGFARVLTPGEAEVYRSHYRIERMETTAASGAGEPGQKLSLNDVERFLDDMAKANAAWSASPGKPTQ
jgi:hypothetical protein